ncbi:MAG: GAF domain-containing sensor histidine kinase [Chloroflexota bacterium]|nr:GAF domain-containing sensor histidine kinase [Chloroflexota bacterium]
MTSNDSQPKEVTDILSTLKMIAEAVIGVAGADTLQQVFQQIAYVAQQLVGARYAALGIPGAGGTMAYFEVVGIAPDAIARIAHPPIGRGLLGVIMHEREILRLEHISDDPRHIGFPPGHPPMERLLGVPIQVGGQLFGMLYLTDRRDDQPFTQEDQWLVESLAGYAALAIAGAQLQDQHRRVTLLEERERVGMDLHDGVIQSLYAIGMQLQLVRLSQPAVADSVSQATRSLDAVIEDIRRYIHNLNAATYERTSIREGLLDVVARLHIPATLMLTVDAPHGPPPFSPSVVEAVCQIAYEVVSNIVRHADATHASITVTEGASSFRMVVQDDGRGFVPDSLDEFSSDALEDTVGLGLRNIVGRARVHNGEVTVTSAPGGGTRVTLTLPTWLVSSARLHGA